MYSMEELYIELDIMLSTLMVLYKRVPLGNNLSDVFEINELGVVVVGIEPIDYSYTMQKIQDRFPGYRVIVVTCEDALWQKKEEVIWELMRSGYIRYIRYKFQRQFDNLIQQGFGRKIITERLRIWGKDPKYKFLVSENLKCLEAAAPYLLAKDPAFFDFMPEDPKIKLHGG